MENPEYGEHLYRLEVDKVRPAQLFEWAKQQQQYKRDRVSDREFPLAIEHIAEMLEGYITRHFEVLPELVIEAKDVFQTLGVNPPVPNALSREINVGPAPLVGDAAIYNAHVIYGRLYGFHRGEMNDLRVYVDTGEEPINLMGGIYTPLLSVGIKDSNIQLAELSAAEKFEELGRDIVRRIQEINDDKLSGLFLFLMSKLNEAGIPSASKLQACSDIVVNMVAQIDLFKNRQLVDDVYDMIRIKLGLNVSQDIRTSSHREVISKEPIPAYKPILGPALFSSVEPQLGLLGESSNRSLGLFFIEKDRAIQVPVQNITGISRAES